MLVLFAASEVHPLAKTGGLADVTGALPGSLRALGLDVRVVMPLYPGVRPKLKNARRIAEHVPCPFAGSNRPFHLLESTLPDGTPILLVENGGVFEAEDAIYGVEPGSYGDGHLRFAYFARALLRVPAAAGFTPDILHLNDWQTALAALLLRTGVEKNFPLAKAATLLTIHNLAYQGVFPVADLRRAGIADALLREGVLLHAGNGNLLAGGLRAADRISTVSRTYAREILSAEFGNGLEGLLQHRAQDLCGIANGLDTSVWNPATDPHLSHHYDVDRMDGKTACRNALLARARLAPTDGPIFGIVSRLAAQKGLDLALEAMDTVLQQRADVRLVVLGSGEPRLEAGFRALEARHSGRAAARLAFDPAFASLVEAGCDLFLMPSRFEPCGLNQLISMRYGTPPIVRRTGGLADTVTDTTERTLSDGTATGFAFEAPTAAALFARIQDALALFADKPRFAQLIQRGMSEDWTWKRSAQAYAALYSEASNARIHGSAARWVRDILPPDPIEVELPILPHVPAGYGANSLRLMPRDPETLAVLWDLALPEHAEIVLELTDLECAGSERRAARVLERQAFFTTRPDTRYRARLLTSGGQELLQSTVVRTPRRRG